MVLSSSVLIEITSSSKEGLYLLAFGAQPTVQGVFAKGNAPSQWKTRSRDIFKRGKAVQYVDGATLSTNSSRVEFAPTTPVHSSRTPQGSFVHASRRLHRAHPPPSWALVRVPRRSFTRWSVVVHGVATIVPPLALQAREISSEPSPRGRLNRLCVRCFFSPFILAVSSGFRSDELQSLRRFPARPSARGASPLRRLPSCVPPFRLLSLPSLRAYRRPSRLPLWWLGQDSSVREGDVAEASTVRAPERVCVATTLSRVSHATSSRFVWHHTAAARKVGTGSVRTWGTRHARPRAEATGTSLVEERAGEERDEPMEKPAGRGRECRAKQKPRRWFAVRKNWRVPLRTQSGGRGAQRRHAERGTGVPPKRPRVHCRVNQRSNN